MKIVQFFAENIKKLRVVEIKPGDGMVQITGANGEGKSSVLDAIYVALAGRPKDVGSMIVRKGEDRAVVRLDLGDIVVTRRFTAAGGTSLEVKAADGAKYSSPQKMLDELLGTLTFDPLAFTRMDAKAQLEQLRSMVALDVDIDALDAENASDFSARAEVNKRVKSLEAQIAAIVVDENLPEIPIDVSAMLKQMESSIATNTAIEKERLARESKRSLLKSKREESDKLRKQAKELLDRAQALNEEADVLSKELVESPALAEPVSTSDLLRDIEIARQTNAKIENSNRRSKLVAELKEAQDQASSLTFKMEERAHLRRTAIANAKMPVDGLSFSDTDPLAGGKMEILYRGIPFTQASQSEQLRVSIAIAMAANPKLRILRIKDGSLLDEKSLGLVADMAQSGDYQVWIEKVDTSGRVGIVMEDGSVKTVNADPAAEVDTSDL